MSHSNARFLALILVLGTSGTAAARDSSWLICKGVGQHGKKGDQTKYSFVVSAHEHRSPSGNGRETSLVFIFGEHVSRGTLTDNKNKSLKLTSIEDKHPVVFTGSGQMPDDLKTLTLTGDLDMSFGADAKTSTAPLTVKLTCEEQADDTSLNH